MLTETTSTICQCTPAIKDGYTWNLFVGEVFGDCIYTPREYLSFFLGLITLVLNFISLVPQIWLNYKNKKTDGLSVGLLVIWIVADVANMIGCLLTDQLITQTLLSIYFIIVDSITIFQCWYYSNNNNNDNHNNYDCDTNVDQNVSFEVPLDTYSITTHPNHTFTNSQLWNPGLTRDFSPLNGQNDNTNNEQQLDNEFNNLLQQDNNHEIAPLLPPTTHTNTNNTPTTYKTGGVQNTTNNNIQKTINSTGLTGTIAIVSIVCIIGIINVASPNTTPKTSQVIEQISSTIPTSITTTLSTLPSCLRLSQAGELGLFIGICISWVSGFLYCLSRTPQIKSNYDFYKLGIPLDGLSPSVFIITALGNICYGVSVVLRNTIDRDFWIKTFPFLLGSLGTIIFDIVILTQIHYYNKTYKQRQSIISSQFGEDEL